MRYKLVLEYDGTNFTGWQKQRSYLTVQEVLETALSKFISQPVSVVGASRTDSGVHALGQVAHVDIDLHWSEYKLKSALNFQMHKYPVRVLQVESKDESFHARKSAKMKEYFYRIVQGSHPLLFNKAWISTSPLNVELMREGAKFLLGNHDFSSFRSGECQALSPTKTLDSILFYETEEEIRITFIARSFLQHQIRKMIGMLALCGSKKIPTYHIESILKKKDRNLCTAMAPPWGLYLKKITYQDPE